MHTKLFLIRKIKGLFIYFQLHKVFFPLWGFLLNLAYLSKLSKWKYELNRLPFDDFYNNDVVYQDRFKLHQFVYDSEELDSDINYLEFGVGEGVSYKWWINKVKNPNARFYGFDTFTGLPEDFGVMKQNDYDTKGNYPDVNNDVRANFIAGMFQDSLPAYVGNIDFSKRTVFHFDADLYSSTLFLFTFLHYKFKKGDIIIFDEFGVPTHEFKAMDDYLSAYKLKFEVIGAVNNYLQIAIKII